jgi:hypothetical protein
MATAITPTTTTRVGTSVAGSRARRAGTDVPPVVLAGQELRREPTSWADRIERVAVFVIPFGIFVVVGWNMAVAHQALPGDAVSRTANASAAVFSRDPHLEAIGFVWPPIPQLVQIPLVWLGRWWPALMRDAFAGVIASAFFMAAMMSAVRTWLVECGVTRLTRLILLVLLLVQPMILLYGSNGMSDAAMLAFLVIAARRLARWFETERVLDLTAASLALGAAYLTRYEVAASILAVTVLVGWVSYGRVRRRRPDLGPSRWFRKSATQMAVAALPAGFAMLLWAFVSWAIVDQPFAQFSSAYGNGQQTRTDARAIAALVGAASGLPRAKFFGAQLVVFGVVAIVSIVVILWWARRGALRMWAAVACVAAPLVFLFVSSVQGTTNAWARYVIAVVPLGTMLLGTLIPNVGRRGGRAVGVTAFAVAISLIGVAISYQVIRHDRLDSRYESRELATLPSPVGRYPTDGLAPLTMPWGKQIARDLDRRGIGRGQVLTDEANSFPVVVNAAHQTDFVIPSDRDFSQVLADPGRFGVRYLLVPDPKRSNFDQLNDIYPTLYRDGAGMAHRVDEWRAGTMRFRLYEMNTVAAHPQKTEVDS